VQHCLFSHSEAALEKTLDLHELLGENVSLRRLAEDMLERAAHAKYPKAMARFAMIKIEAEGLLDSAIRPYLDYGTIYGDPTALRLLGENLFVSGHKAELIRGLSYLDLASDFGDTEATQLYLKHVGTVDANVISSADAAAESWAPAPYPIEMWTIHSGFSPRGWKPMFDPYVHRNECEIS
jgi:hypothetical protein